MLIHLNTFKGMAPALDITALADNAAQSATNIDFSGGTLRPMILPELIDTTSLNRSGTTSSMYRYLHDGVGYWLTWVGGVTANVCLSSVPDDVYDRVFWTTSNGQPQQSSYTAIVTGGGAYPNASYNLGIPAPADTFTLTAAGTGDEPIVQETRGYVITFVEETYAGSNAPGFEGPPSGPVLITIDVGQTVDLASLPGKPSGSNLIAFKRIYRINTGTAGSEYQYVATIPVANTTYSDTVLNENLGEVLPVNNWIAPPTTLRGLITLPSGSLAGFSGNVISFSVPYVPTAYPAEYDMAVDFPIVTIAGFGSGILVLTQGNPYVITGMTPGAMSIEKLELGTACVSAKGVVDFGDTIVYPSTRGLVAVGVQGITNLTEGLVNQKTWDAIHPATALASRHDSSYIAWTDNTQIIFNIKTGDYSLHSIGWTPCAVFADPVDGALYLAKAETSNDGLYRWGTGATGTATWKSKRFRTPMPVSMAAARVIAESYTSVTCKVYADGVLKHTQTVTSRDPFRLPAGFLAHFWEIEIITTSTVIDVAVATAMRELVA